MKRLIKQFAVVTLAVGILTGCATNRNDVGSWEYKVVSRDAYAEATAKQLNELAEQGWSVVSVSTSYRGDNRVPAAVIVLKRPKQP